jgi:hypothetical protein
MLHEQVIREIINCGFICVGGWAGPGRCGSWTVGARLFLMETPRVSIDHHSSVPCIKEYTRLHLATHLFAYLSIAETFYYNCASAVSDLRPNLLNPLNHMHHQESVK